MTRSMLSGSARLSAALAAAALQLASSAAPAQMLAGDDLIDALQGGGHVIVMRHADSPMAPPEPRQQAPGNVRGERQLSDDGKAQMTAMGYAFRELALPVGETMTSPAYRAVESAEYFGFGDLIEIGELGPSGEGAFLRRLATQVPPDGENTVIVTHRPLMTAAFGDAADGIEAGTALVFRPDGDNAAHVATVTIRDWAVMAVN